jgi:EAL domain-containing protein (putative c-di-GMP-specific phosphodiesterase class I)
MLRQADQAMYQAKQSGRNRYAVFDPEHDRRIADEQRQIGRLQKALACREFLLHYQPKVHMRDGRIVGAEALIRWLHPERGLLPPGEFLPLIDDHELVVDIGEWVIEAALVQMSEWHSKGLVVPVSVNIAARQLQHPEFVERLQQALARFPTVPPHWLELEVLESATLGDIALASRVIESCRALGVAFALDDFGTGYSSLAYLKRLPANVLKIDQSFVRDMLRDPEDRAIVAGVIGLTRAFNRTVIAEGVETEAHGVMLLQLGCELAQGYGIARPMPAAQLEQWASEWATYPAWAAVK